MIKKNVVRSNGIDQFAGVCIIFMIFTHICQLSYQTGWPVYMKSLGIFYFYMYFFFWKSGLYFHEVSVRECVSKNARRLLYPYFLYMLIGHAIHCIKSCLEGDLTAHSCFVQPFREIYHWGASLGNLPLWFLLCLFLVKVAYNIISKCHIKPAMVLMLSFLAAVYLQYAEMKIGGIEIPYTIGAFFISMAIYAFAIISRRIVGG